MKVYTVTEHNNNDDQWVIAVVSSLEQAEAVIAEHRKEESVDIEFGAVGIYQFFAEEDGLSYFVEEYQLNKLL